MSKGVRLHECALGPAQVPDAVTKDDGPAPGRDKAL